MKAIIVSALIAIALSIASRPAIAQTSKNPSDEFMLWGCVGLGMVGPGIGGHIKAAYGWGHSTISVKSESGTEINTNIFGPSKSLSGISFFYGWREATKNTMYRVAAGPAYYTHSVDTTSLWGTRSSSVKRLGGGLEAEAMYKWSYFGMSAVAGVLVAKDLFYLSFTVNINLGKLR